MFDNFSGKTSKSVLRRNVITLPEFNNLDSAQLLAGPDLGGKLRTRRRGLDLTLRQVAEQAKCSESMICKIETGKVNPSLTLLRRLAETLSINVAALFDESGPAEVVQRAGYRPRLDNDVLRQGDGVVLERLVPHAAKNALQANIHIIGVGGASDGLITHAGEEVGYVLEGEVELTVGEERWHLRAGDSFHFRSEQAHGYRNLGRTTAQILWVNTPPTF